MAQTDVTIDATAGPSANPMEVRVVDGDTLTITASGGSANLYFSPGCLSVLSPAPEAEVALDEGDSLDFTFTSSAPGNYMVWLSADAGLSPHFFPIHAPVLTFNTFLHRVRVGMGGGPNNTTQGNL